MKLFNSRSLLSLQCFEPKFCLKNQHFKQCSLNFLICFAVKSKEGLRVGACVVSLSKTL